MITKNFRAPITLSRFLVGVCTAVHMCRDDESLKRQLDEGVVEEEEDEEDEFITKWLASNKAAEQRTSQRFTRRRIDDGIDVARSVLSTVQDAVIPTRVESPPFLPGFQPSGSPIQSLQTKLQIATAEGQLHAQR
jgi:hypothetical protein